MPAVEALRPPVALQHPQLGTSVSEAMQAYDRRVEQPRSEPQSLGVRVDVNRVQLTESGVTGTEVGKPSTSVSGPPSTAISSL